MSAAEKQQIKIQEERKSSAGGESTKLELQTRTTATNKSKEDDNGNVVSGEVKDAFDTLEKNLDAGLAALVDEFEAGNDTNASCIEDKKLKKKNTAVAAADDGVRESEEMARKMAEEAASFAAAVAKNTIDSTADDVPPINIDRSDEPDTANQHSGQNNETTNIDKEKKINKSSNSRISTLVLALVGIIIVLGFGAAWHAVANSSNPSAEDSTKSKDEASIFDVVKEWNTKHEKEKKYNEAMRNMLHPKREKENYQQQEYHDGSSSEQYIISGDGRLASLVNAMYQPVYYVTYRPIQRVKYYYYRTPTQEQMIVQKKGSTMYARPKIVQNVHHASSHQQQQQWPSAKRKKYIVG